MKNIQMSSGPFFKSLVEWFRPSRVSLWQSRKSSLYLLRGLAKGIFTYIGHAVFKLMILLLPFGGICDSLPGGNEYIRCILLMVQKSQGQPFGMVLKPCKSYDFNDLSLNWCSLDFWLPSTISTPRLLTCQVLGQSNPVPRCISVW